jgi:hypothetical protein
VEKVQSQAGVIREHAQTLRTNLEAGVDRVRNVVTSSASTVNGTAAAGGQAIIADLVASSQRAIDATQKTFDELQKGLEDKFKAVGSISRFTPVGREMDEIRKRLAELEQRLEKL